MQGQIANQPVVSSSVRSNQIGNIANTRAQGTNQNSAQFNNANVSNGAMS
jgi:hypothetical protein